MLILPYPLPVGATLCWMPHVSLCSEHQQHDAECPRCNAVAPYPGDEIGWREEYDDNAYECVVDRCDGSNAIRPRATVKRVVRACRAKDVPHDECMLMGFLEEWSDSPTPREQFEDAIENIETWGFLVEVEMKHG